MAGKIPFDEDVMTLIMGVEPSEPGQHGRTMAPKPDKDAIGLVCQIRDLCEEFLARAGKEDGEEGPEDEDKTYDNEEEEDGFQRRGEKGKEEDGESPWRRQGRK